MKFGSRLINARIEGIEEKPSFRQAFSKRRCIVPFDGYYEWQKTPEGKVPYRIQLKNTEIFTIAGLYEHWKDPEGKQVDSFTLITREANPTIRHLHDRQPFVLLPEQEKLWLDNHIPSKDLIHELDEVPGEYFTWYRVSTRVNKVTENDAGLIEPV
jgi:putative SOS response-associated peptidase YedK